MNAQKLPLPIAIFAMATSAVRVLKDLWREFYCCKLLSESMETQNNDQPNWPDDLLHFLDIPSWESIEKHFESSNRLQSVWSDELFSSSNFRDARVLHDLFDEQPKLSSSCIIHHQRFFAAFPTRVETISVHGWFLPFPLAPWKPRHIPGRGAMWFGWGAPVAVMLHTHERSSARGLMAREAGLGKKHPGVWVERS